MTENRDRQSIARDYLADALWGEGEDSEENEEWYNDLADYVNDMPSDDPLCTRLSVCLEPFIVDDERIECAMYPVGEAITYLEEEAPEGDFRFYIEGLVCAIEQDHNRWIAHVAVAGDAASWTLESGPPTVIGLLDAP